MFYIIMQGFRDVRWSAEITSSKIPSPRLCCTTIHPARSWGQPDLTGSFLCDTRGNQKLCSYLFECLDWNWWVLHGSFHDLMAAWSVMQSNSRGRGSYRTRGEMVRKIEALYDHLIIENVHLWCRLWMLPLLLNTHVRWCLMKDGTKITCNVLLR